MTRTEFYALTGGCKKGSTELSLNELLVEMQQYLEHVAMVFSVEDTKHFTALHIGISHIILHDKEKKQLLFLDVVDGDLVVGEDPNLVLCILRSEGLTQFFFPAPIVEEMFRLKAESTNATILDRDRQEYERLKAKFA